MKKLASLLICIALSLTLSACNGTSKGPDATTKCVGGTGSSSSSGSTTTSDSGENTAAKIDAALRNCKIITTIVNKLKAEVIGSQGFGVPGGGSSDSSTDASCSADTSGTTTDTNFGAEGIFQSFASSTEFQGAIGAAFTLYIVIYGVALAAGMAQASLGEAAIKVGKLVVVAALATSWPFFYQIVGSFFINGTDEIIGYFLQNFSQFYQNANTTLGGAATSAIGAASPTDNIFTSLDNFIASIFSYQTYAFVAALFNAGPYAPVYASILIMSLFWVLRAVIKVVTVYIFSLFAKALLLAVAPIFLVFLLFGPTRPMFDAWLKELAGFSLQPIMVMAFIGLFAQLLQPFFDQFATYKLCWFQLHDADNKYGWEFTQNGSSTDTGGNPGVNSAPPIGLQTVLLFAFFAWLFQTALNMVDALVLGITQSKAISGLTNLAAFSNFNRASDKLGNISDLPKKIKEGF